MGTPLTGSNQGVGRRASHAPAGWQGERRKRGTGKYELNAARTATPLLGGRDRTPELNQTVSWAGIRHDLVEKHGSPITTHSRLTRAIREADSERLSSATLFASGCRKRRGCFSGKGGAGLLFPACQSGRKC